MSDKQQSGSFSLHNDTVDELLAHFGIETFVAYAIITRFEQLREFPSYEIIEALTYLRPHHIDMALENLHEWGLITDEDVVANIESRLAERARRNTPRHGPSKPNRRMLAVGARDGWNCHYCGVALTSKLNEPNSANTDHKVPRSKGGSDDLDNLVLACARCNTRKHARYTYDEFLALVCSECSEP